MQSWFFIDQNNSSALSKVNNKLDSKIKMSNIKNESIDEEKYRKWKFTVVVPDIGCKDKVFLTGNISELGEWDYQKLVPMQCEGGNVWTSSVSVPDCCDFQYRYVICYVPVDSSNFIIRQWETHLQPRVIKGTTTHPVEDLFGIYDNKTKISTGWLTSHTLIQLKFTNNPLKLKRCLINRLLHIKVTPMKLVFGVDPPIDESSLSMDTMDAEVQEGVVVEVSTLDNDAAVCVFQPQQQFGRAYKPNDIVLINLLVPKPEELAYLVDFYTYSSHAGPSDPPAHIGYTYILPNQFKQSEGGMELPVSCNVKHRPLGTVNIEYLMIRPMSSKLCDLQVSYSKHWDPSWTGLEVGHRGLGASFKTKGGNAIRENTVASLKTAAASGADLLEFDVQLSKDLVPVIYHDFHVCISMKRKKEMDYNEMLELPVKDLTLEHLQKLKVYHLVEGRNHEILFYDEDLEDHQPFPTLEHVLKEIDVHVGFNIELKWTMELDDGTFELNNPFDMNTYVDKMLEVVLQHGGDRRIVFSCFNPDICTMVRNKQNKYPVMFLTVGITQRYQSYRDARCRSIQLAVQSAISSDILGVVVHTEDLLRDPTQVKLATDAGLVIFCWGDDNNDRDTIRKLKQLGLHAVIYDKLDQYTTKEVKESIFLMEARESQRDLMRLTAVDQTPSSSSSSLPPPACFLPARPAPLSTATSLESIVDDDISDKQLKRKNDIITTIDKEMQVKENRMSFRGMFPAAGDSALNKKSRKSD